ncbi:dTDP-4-dehydrorhamnose 3,5-epimerase family protein [Cellulomonas composti]|uniref:dTDP-4-dehydrorhamnose 3,5-epimerase RmlC n=1 Tax=Cellulomonas composti TaxID=266130 RepID=A0A511JD23_9CELL|nr:dTDP-4-dehydrorhamnose 3,5-epimerase [Cellulomonas composti]GEL95846.1 DTDP-4-dehydrorhamnose 3,5-epimerase RmlC [Cellulomonas composti]
MGVEPLAVAGAFVVENPTFGDARGRFQEWFRGADLAAAIGHRFDLHQANVSVSAAGVLRGVHFADVPPGQAKYVTCVAGAVLDVVVDLRVGSPTFGRWDSVLLDDVGHRAVYLSEGLGHAFLSLADGSTVVYLCSAPYAPTGEHGVHPLDPDLAIDWPTTGRDGSPLVPVLSDKDRDAPSLADALAAGLLPRADEVAAYVAERSARS